MVLRGGPRGRVGRRRTCLKRVAPIVVERPSSLVWILWWADVGGWSAWLRDVGRPRAAVPATVPARVAPGPAAESRKADVRLRGRPRPHAGAPVRPQAAPRRPAAAGRQPKVTARRLNPAATARVTAAEATGIGPVPAAPALAETLLAETLLAETTRRRVITPGAARAPEPLTGPGGPSHPIATASVPRAVMARTGGSGALRLPEGPAGTHGRQGRTVAGDRDGSLRETGIGRAIARQPVMGSGARTGRRRPMDSARPLPASSQTHGRVRPVAVTGEVRPAVVAGPGMTVRRVPGGWPVRTGSGGAAGEPNARPLGGGETWPRPVGPGASFPAERTPHPGHGKAAPGFRTPSRRSSSTPRPGLS